MKLIRVSGTVLLKSYPVVSLYLSSAAWHGVAYRGAWRRLMELTICCPQKFELEKKLVSGKVRSGKGRKKAEKARRRAEREASVTATADTSMSDAPKATKGLNSSRAQPPRAVSSMNTDA